MSSWMKNPAGEETGLLIDIRPDFRIVPIGGKPRLMSVALERDS